MFENDEMVPYPVAAAITGLKIPTIQSMVCRRQVPFYRLGKRLVVFSRRELEAWMKERRVDPLSSPAPTVPDGRVSEGR